MSQRSLAAKVEPLPWLLDKRHASVLFLNRFSNAAKGNRCASFSPCADALNDQADDCGNGTSLLVPIISCLTTNPSGVMSAAAVKSREAFQPQRVATTDAGAGRNSNTHTSSYTAIGTSSMSCASARTSYIRNRSGSVETASHSSSSADMTSLLVMFARFLRSADESITSCFVPRFRPPCRQCPVQTSASLLCVVTPCGAFASEHRHTAENVAQFMRLSALLGNGFPLWTGGTLGLTHKVDPAPRSHPPIVTVFWESTRCQCAMLAPTGNDVAAQ